ncbi:MAG: hypothetical protein JNK12_07985 [Acidimicrobiales bacterium]|nr:hypothetical protein [Acidimicrobiales bacterium]
MGRSGWARKAGAVAALTLAAAACGSGGGDDAAPADDTTVGTSVATTDDSEADSAVGGCPDATTLEVVNGESARGAAGDPVTLASGPVDVATSFADDSGSSASFVFADYEVAADPQFGLSAPVGDPEVPAGGLIMVVTISTGGEGEITAGEYRALETGEGAVDSPGDLTDPDATIPDVPPSVSFEALYLGDDRVLPIGFHSVSVTEITDTAICGEITGDTGETELQADGFPVLEGTFVAERV